MVWKTTGYRKFGTSYKARSPRASLSRFQVGDAVDTFASHVGIVGATQNTVITLTEADFQGANQRLPGLSKVNLTYSQIPTTASNMLVDVFILRLPVAVATPSLTGSQNWADLLKGVQVLGYKRFLIGLTTIPRIARVPVRSFPSLSLSESIRLVTVARTVGGVATTAILPFRVVPMFRV